MYWKNDPNGSGYRIRQFDNPVNHSMRNLAIEELTAPPKKRRGMRSLRLILPAWLSGRATLAAKQMEEETKEPNRKE